jgi:hypothetical protein
MKINYEIPLASTLDGALEKSCEYWKERGFKIVQSDDLTFSATRGRLKHNMYSFNMAKLKTTLYVTKTDKEIVFEFDINTAFQQITESNANFWELELEECEHFLCTESLLPQKWNMHNKQAGKSNVLWVLSIVSISIISIVLSNLWSA